jgi:hypothetical protein
MTNGLKICVTFDPIKYDTVINFEKVISHIESISDFELVSKMSYRVEFISKDKRKDLLIHSDGMLYLYINVEDTKRDLLSLIGDGYDLIKKLKEIDLRYRKAIGVTFKGKNVIKVYKDEEKRLKGSVEGILGDVKMKEIYISDTFSRVDYRPSEILL